MHYRGDLTKKILSNLHSIPDFELDAYSGYIHSSQYLHTCDREDITENDTVLLSLTIDRAQLYRMKESDLRVQGRQAAYTIPEVLILTEPRKPSPYS